MFSYLMKVAEESLHKVLSIPDVNVTFRSRVTTVIGVECKCDIIDTLRSIDGVTDVQYERKNGRLSV